MGHGCSIKKWYLRKVPIKKAEMGTAMVLWDEMKDKTTRMFLEGEFMTEMQSRDEGVS